MVILQGYLDRHVFIFNVSANRTALRWCFLGAQPRVPDTVLPMMWNSSCGQQWGHICPHPQVSTEVFPHENSGFGPGILHVYLLEEKVCTFLFIASKTRALREL